jgi:hypothetical protein
LLEFGMRYPCLSLIIDKYCSYRRIKHKTEQNS